MNPGDILLKLNEVDAAKRRFDTADANRRRANNNPFRDHRLPQLEASTVAASDAFRAELEELRRGYIKATGDTEAEHMEWSQLRTRIFNRYKTVSVS